MNKSFALKKKIYLFLSLVFSFLIFIYLLYFLINGDRGIISYYKIDQLKKSYQLEFDNLKRKNDSYNDKVSRLKPDNIDLDYLDELLRLKTGYFKKNELIISLED